MKVNHSIHFVDPPTHATTHHVEVMWSRANQRDKKECGANRTQLDSDLIEFMWRKQFKFKRDPFETLLAHIRDVYPL